MFDFFSKIWTWLNETIYTFYTDTINYFVVKAKIFYWDTLTDSMQFFSSIVLSVIDASAFTSSFLSHYLDLSSNTQYMLAVLQVPACINILLTAYTVKIVISLLGIGK